MLKGDYNVNNANKVTFRYNQLDSSSRFPRTDRPRSARRPADQTRPTSWFANSNYAILENLKSGVGEWNSVFGNMTNNLLDRLYEAGREPRRADKLFPFVVIGDGAGCALTSFGSEPFTPFNLLALPARSSCRTA